MSTADDLLRLWVAPINWEDGSALVEDRLIEGKQTLLDATVAYLASAQAAPADASLAALAQRWIDYETLDTAEYRDKYGVAWDDTRGQRKYLVERMSAALTAQSTETQP